MRNCTRPLAAAVVLAVISLRTTTAAAQQAQNDAPEPPPPELQRLIELAKDPDRVRELMSDPQKLDAVMNTLESDAVRQYVSDPRHVQQLMREIDPQQIQEAMRAVDFSKVRQAAAARWKAQLKRQLEVSDEEWKVMEPRIDNVVRARQDAGAGGGAGRFGGARTIPAPPPADAAAEPSAARQAAAELRAAMNDPDTPPAEVRRLLQDYRRARDKAREKLDAAERELRDVLTLRQEGILVTAGLLN